MDIITTTNLFVVCVGALVGAGATAISGAARMILYNLWKERKDRLLLEEENNLSTEAIELLQMAKHLENPIFTIINNEERVVISGRNYQSKSSKFCGIEYVFAIRELVNKKKILNENIREVN